MSLLSGDCNVCMNRKMSSYSVTCVECGLSRKNYKPMTKADKIRGVTEMDITKPQITNDISSPCNKNRCSAETISSCCGCPEWFTWKTDNEYIGKHLKKENKS